MLETYDWGLEKSGNGTSNSRTPLSLVYEIADIIKDKVFCDLGCGEGDLCLCCKHFAKKVIGVEGDKDRALIAKMKGVDVITGDLLTMEIPDADVYFIWIGNKNGIVFNKIKLGKTVILGPQIELKEWVEKLNAEKKSLLYIRNSIKMVYDYYIIKR